MIQSSPVTGFFAILGEIPVSQVKEAARVISHRAWEGFLIDSGRESFVLKYEGERPKHGMEDNKSKLDSEFHLEGLSSHDPVIVCCLREKPSRFGNLWTHGSVYSENGSNFELEFEGRLSNGYFEDLSQSLSGADGAYSLVARYRRGLLLARDPLGVKPLYLASKGRVHGIATEPKVLRRLGFMEIIDAEPGSVVYLERDSTKAEKFSKFPRKGAEVSLEDSSHRILELLRLSMKRRLSQVRRVAVSFSGGLDSSLLAYLASEMADVTLVSVHAQGSLDSGWAREASIILGLPLESVSIDTKVVKETLPWIKELIEREGSMDIAIATALHLSARRAREIGVKDMIVGQLADELFGGYAKYLAGLQRGVDVNEMMTNDVYASSSNTFPRDDMATSPYTMAIFPFASLPLIEYAISLPLKMKIDGEKGLRKVVLTEAAKITGLPSSIAERSKKAVQYSSGILKLVKELAS